MMEITSLSALCYSIHLHFDQCFDKAYLFCQNKNVCIIGVCGMVEHYFISNHKIFIVYIV